MATYGNNFQEKNARTRDSFFESLGERALLEDLMKIRDVRQIRDYLIQNFDGNFLNGIALTINVNIEGGVYTQEQMPAVEETMAVVLSSIEDAQKVKEVDCDNKALSIFTQNLISAIEQIMQLDHEVDVVM